MTVSSVAASHSALVLSTFQAQASLLVLNKTLELQQASAAHMLGALPDPAATVGGRIDTWA